MTGRYLTRERREAGPFLTGFLPFTRRLRVMERFVGLWNRGMNWDYPSVRQRTAETPQRCPNVGPTLRWCPALVTFPAAELADPEVSRNITIATHDWALGGGVIGRETARPHRRRVVVLRGRRQGGS